MTNPAPDAAPTDQGRSPLYAELEHRVYQFYRPFLNDKVIRWTFAGTNCDARVTDFYGKDVYIGRLAFDGSIRDRFWGEFVEPFLQEFIVKLVAEAVRLADERGIERAAVLRDAHGLLRMVVRGTYHRMEKIEHNQLNRDRQTILTRKLPPIRWTDSRPMEERMTTFLDHVIKAQRVTTAARPRVETRDAAGFVIDPADPTAYWAASKILALHPTVAKSMKALQKILNSSDIRRWRPAPQRLSVHAGDFQRYVDSLSARGAVDDPDEIAARTRAVRAASTPRPKARDRTGSNFPPTSQPHENR